MHRFSSKLEELKKCINKYVVFSYVDETKGSDSAYEKWIMLVKKVGRIPHESYDTKLNGELYNVKVYGLYLSQIYPKFRPYHTPTRQNPEKNYRYCNAQRSFRLATPKEIKTLRCNWSKLHIETLGKKPKEEESKPYSYSFM